MQMAVGEIKNVLDRPVKLLVEDDETDPQVAARKARRLIEVDKVKFLIGGVSSSVAVSVGEVAQRAGVLYIATNQNSDTITGEEGPSLCLPCLPGHGHGPEMPGALRH